MAIIKLKKFEIELRKLELELYGMTQPEALAKNICLKCKKESLYYSEAGKRKYQFSALCEYCFDDLDE